jgi:uncharacterized protein YbjT (DUF2867 family)
VIVPPDWSGRNRSDVSIAVLLPQSRNGRSRVTFETKPLERAGPDVREVDERHVIFPAVSVIANPPSRDLAHRHVLITGATGYIGRALMPVLLTRGHQVRALVRPGSETKLPRGADAVIGNPLDANSIASALADIDVVVHLVGVPKPSPAKAAQFRTIDLVSIQALVTAAEKATPRPHLVYLSVAQPAPVMRAYVAVRAEGEALIRRAGFDATFVRPWYVLGPGHRWPYVLLPVYAVLRWLPPTRAGAQRLGLVTLPQMIAALTRAVEQRPNGVRIVDVPAIRASVA